MCLERNLITVDLIVKSGNIELATVMNISKGDLNMHVLLVLQNRSALSRYMELPILYTLFELPYYDCKRFPIIDPMHVVFLGVAKHTFKVWGSHELLPDSAAEHMQKHIDQLITPNYVG